jgi:hypothetical protein
MLEAVPEPVEGRGFKPKIFDKPPYQGNGKINSVIMTSLGK